MPPFEEIIGMARHVEPYTVITRPPSEYWYYKLGGWKSYRSTGIRIVYDKSGRPKNRREAERFAIERSRAEEILTKAQSLRDYLQPFFVWDQCPHIARMLADGKRYTESFATQQRRRIEMHVFTDEIAECKLSSLRPGDFEDWKARLLKKKIGKRTINMTLSAVRTAIREGLHRRDPAVKFDPTAGVGSIHHEAQIRGIFTLEELKALLNDRDVWKSDRELNATMHRPNHDYVGIPSNDFWVFALALFCTGERPSAWRALRWRDIDGDVVHFRQTKTTSGRQVPIIPELAAALTEMREDGVRVADDDLIWCYRNGKPYGKTWFRARFAMALEHAGVSEQDADGNPRTPYSFKHSLITHLIDAGVDEVLVREYVGHSHGYGMTRVLTPVQARYKRRQAERLREILPAIQELLS